jgi:hypothetical protein
MTMVAGATDVVWVQHLVRAAEARLVPTRLFEETSLPRRLLGAGYRVATLIALDLPQDHFLMVVAHEVYGHGARLRELGAPAIGYQFDGPIPYGKGGASTRFELPPETTSTTRAGLAIAGIEAQEVLAAALRSQALARGAISNRAWPASGTSGVFRPAPARATTSPRFFATSTPRARRRPAAPSRRGRSSGGRS